MARFVDTFVGARVYNNASISINDSTWTSLTLNTERYDTDTIHSTGANTSRLTCFTAGKYIIIANTRWESNAAGTRNHRIWLNGDTSIGRTEVKAAAVQHTYTTSTIYDLSVTDYVEIQVWQNSGGAIDSLVQANNAPEFMMHRIAP